MHIVFKEEDSKALSSSFPLEETLNKPVIVLKDDYSVGPLTDIYRPEGLQARDRWWRNVFFEPVTEGEEKPLLFSDKKSMETIREHLQSAEDAEIWIWVGPNSRDVSGYYWLISQLKDYVGKVHVLHLNNLPFINEKGAVFYPVYLHEIPAAEFVKARKLARQVTASEFELDPDEWFKICQSGKGIRLLEGARKLALREEDAFDKALLDALTDNWQKSGRLVQTIVTKSKIPVPSSILLWRLAVLAHSGKAMIQGVPSVKKDFEIRKVQADSE